MVTDPDLTQQLLEQVSLLRTEVGELREQTVVSSQATQRLSASLEIVNVVQQRQQVLQEETQKLAARQQETVETVVPREEHVRRWKREDERFLEVEAFQKKWALYVKRHRRLITLIWLVIAATTAAGGWLSSRASDAADEARNAAQAQKRASYQICQQRNASYDNARRVLPKLIASAPNPQTADLYRALLATTPKDADCEALLR